MKIAYISQTALSDVDFSYIKEAQKLMDITYYIQVSPSTRHKAAVSFDSLPEYFAIIPANNVPELKVFGRIVDLNKVFVINQTATSNYQLRNIFESYKVYRELRKKKYDVIHLTWPPSILDLFPYLLKHKTVLTVHDPFSHSSVHNYVREMERKRSFRLFDHFIVLNKSQKKDFIKCYHLEKLSKKVYTSLLGRYDYLNIYNDHIQETNLQHILFFGNVSSYKGIDVLLEAMILVHQQNPSVKLIVAGGGRYWFDISRYNKLDYIEIRNRYIPDVELVELISSSAYVVVPYKDATQSGVIMTAYAFNKPCIASNVGALPEVVKDGVNGLIVPPNDTEALAQSILYLSSHPEKIDYFSKNISSTYEKGLYSWESIACQYLDIYNSMRSSDKAK